MKIVVTGASGHISGKLAGSLLEAGHSVTVIGRSAAHLEKLTAAGATAAEGSVEDVDFLTRTFTGADTVYTMVPPNFGASDWKGWIGSIGANYAKAIKAAGVKYVVNLSSVGAHLPEGCGPVSGLYRVEKALNELKDVHIKHLRPMFFFDNLLANIAMVKNMNIIGANYGGGDHQIALVAPADIADVAFEELNTLAFTGHSVRYIASDERTGAEIAAVIGAAIGKPGLPWVEFTDEQSVQGMLMAGLTQEVASNYAEMGLALRNGTMQADFRANHSITGKTKLEDFATVFAQVYQQN